MFLYIFYYMNLIFAIMVLYYYYLAGCSLGNNILFEGIMLYKSPLIHYQSARTCSYLYEVNTHPYNNNSNNMTFLYIILD